MSDATIEEAVRLQHCAKKDRDHACMGTCAIKPDGSVDLSCPLCGDDTDYGKSTELKTIATAPYIAIARQVLSALGIDWHAFGPAAQMNVIRELKSRSCPGCGRVVAMSDYQTCYCGEWFWTTRDHWHKNEKKKP